VVIKSLVAKDIVTYLIARSVFFALRLSFQARDSQAEQKAIPIIVAFEKLIE
jgi:hypothetical protein